MTSFSRREVARHKCLDCGINVIKAGDYCLLNSKIWKNQLGLGWNDNLCIACIEARLGRKLRLLDFISFPLVKGFPTSDTLAERYGFKKARKKRVMPIRNRTDAGASVASRGDRS